MVEQVAMGLLGLHRLRTHGGVEAEAAAGNSSRQRPQVQRVVSQQRRQHCSPQVVESLLLPC